MYTSCKGNRRLLIWCWLPRTAAQPRGSHHQALLRQFVEGDLDLKSILALCRREAKAEAVKASHTAELDAAAATYDAKSDPNSAGTDPMRTLFVSRLDFSTTESDLYAEFEKHGAIRQLKLIKNPDGKSRGCVSLGYLAMW